jgi:hypothetical protein
MQARSISFKWSPGADFPEPLVAMLSQSLRMRMFNVIDETMSTDPRTLAIEILENFEVCCVGSEQANNLAD